MEFKISGKNITVTDDLREYVEKRFAKFGKFFTDETEIHVLLSKTRGEEKAEATIPMKGTTIRAEIADDDLYTAIDRLQAAVERQLSKSRNKLIERHQDRPSLSSYFVENQDDWDVADEDDTIQIVKTKHFAIKPMDPEEACFQMDMLGHNFYVFYNSETDLVSVVYKRNDGNYGLIEPEY